MAAEKVRVAVVGAGAFGQAHLRAYAQLDRADVVWVCDPDVDAARRAATEFGVPNVAADLEAVLADDGVQVVDLVTPVALHAPQAKAALEAGRSVVCEKPMALDLPEALALAEIAASSPGELLVKYHQRFDPVHERMRDLLADGTHGTGLVAHIEILGDHLAALRSREHWRGDPRLTGGGCLFESGSHLIDLAHFWFGPAARVTATTHQLAAANPDKGEDTATLVVQFTNGAVMTLVGFWGAPGWDWRKEVFTSHQARLSVETGASNALRLRGRDGTDQVLAVEEDWFARSVRRSLAHALDCAAGDAAPQVTVEDALASMRTLDAAYRSAREGRTVELA
ncbi:Gfo/Idh/MocA family protein [Occultella aeris]|uniref:4-carboxy-2-hydroxymuconate-6-semialdehyde dehydrogenase n=1 Tax=Occultella aeris TaxID=2761496 RepID=A0A7M4DRG9_9MICO|nr:Gfo/Idh/MocA family oxidoreductase [Occultella aeris]VZO40063.1 4-carboxy-2-hydroxymuconate-6-semialdehyde dehydrogenase [Occultella aeris]